MTKCKNAKWHADGVPGVRYAFPQEILSQQTLPAGLDLVRECECGTAPFNRRMAVAKLTQKRFGRPFRNDPYYGEVNYLTIASLPSDVQERLAPVVGRGGNIHLAAWLCSSGLYFVRRLKDGPDRPLSVEHIIKVPGRKTKPQMLKVPGRRRPGYLTGARA